jgi:hypothetical protein
LVDGQNHEILKPAISGLYIRFHPVYQPCFYFIRKQMTPFYWHCKVTCILYKKQAHFSQLFCLQVRSVTPWQLHDRKSRCWRGRRHSSSRYVFPCVMSSYHPFYFDFHSIHIIFDVSFGFLLWNVSRCRRGRRHSSILYSPSGFFSSYFINEVNF